MNRLKSWAGAIKRDVFALWLAARDPRTPCVAKAMAVVVVAYAMSPIDLIPDFVPVLGYLDDIILLPIGIMATVALIPPKLMGEFRETATPPPKLSASRIAAAVIVLLWVLMAALTGWVTYEFLNGSLWTTTAVIDDAGLRA